MTTGRALCFALAFCLSVGSATRAGTDTEDPLLAAWRRVGLGWEPLRGRLRNTLCQSDRSHFEACLLAIAAVAASHRPPLRPVPGEGPFGGAVWSSETADGERSLRSRYSLEARARRERALAESWARAPVGGVRFESMFASLQAGLDPEQTAGLSARGIAAFLRRSLDPHTAIAPYHAVDAAYHHALRGIPTGAFQRRAQGRTGSVQSELLFERAFQLVWVRVDNLDDVACVEVSSALMTPPGRDGDGIILDLRGNLGGVSREAACIADLFLPLETPIVRLEPLVPDFDTSELRAQSGVLVDTPLVVLVDSWSASGAEVIAASLQAHRRALVVGARTFGKGTYQEASPWVEHADVVFYRTVARMVIDGRFEFQIHGVRPDLRGPPASFEAGEVLREENAYLNPIAAVYPPVPRREVEGMEQCLRTQRAERGAEPGDLDLARRALWCLLSGTLPRS